MNTLKDMVLGKPAPLVSTFRLSYYSILNLMSRAEGQFTAEHVIRNSFHQFQYEKVSVEPFPSKYYIRLYCMIIITYKRLTVVQAIPDIGNKISKLEQEAALLDASGEVIFMSQPSIWFSLLFVTMLYCCTNL